jgi:hypothetical protein
MTLVEKYNSMPQMKVAFAKDTGYAEAFAIQTGSHSMYLKGFGLSVSQYLSPEMQLRGVFTAIINNDGIFLFNISGVNLKRARKGFKTYQDAEENSLITEWELFIILSDSNYLKRTIFHNGKVEFKKTILWKSIT